MTDQNTVQMLEKVKGLLVKLAAKKTRVELEDTTFEYSGELTEGTELNVIEGELNDTIELENGLTLSVKDNKVVSLSSEESEEEEVELESDDDDEMEFATAELVDGTTIKWEGDNISEGTEIMVVTEDGEEVPAPDATHELMDGTMVTTADGIVTSIDVVEGEDEDEEELAEDEDMEEDEEEMIDEQERINQLEGHVGVLTERVESLEEILQEMTALNEELTTQVEKLSKEPAVSTKKATVKGSFNKTESRSAQILKRVNRN